MDDTTTVYEASFDVSMATAQTISDEIYWPETFAFPPTVTTFETPEDPMIWKVRVYHNGLPNANTLKEIIATFNQVPGVEIDGLAFEAVEDKDWVSESQKQLAPVEAGRFIAFGSHDKDNIDASKIPLLVDAGQAFGTGSHETTKGCLMFLDQLEAGGFTPKNALDLGSGSGILAMGSLSLWDVPVLATDNDDVAVERAAFILGENDKPTRPVGTMDQAAIALVVADGFEDGCFQAEGPFDLITANILAAPLIRFAHDVVKNMNKGGKLILAGLMIDQEDDVIAAYKREGLTLSQKRHDGNWSILLMEK